MKGAGPMMRLEDLPLVLTPAEVAKVFKVGLSTVYMWAQTGALRSIPLPTRGDKRRPMRRFGREAVLALLRLGEPVVDSPPDGAGCLPSSSRHGTAARRRP